MNDTPKAIQAAPADPVRLAELQLCEIFNVQIPPSIPELIRRRLFTIAARDNVEKVLDNPDIVVLLETVGAYVPVRVGGSIRCFGVLWEPKDRICTICGMEATCKIRAQNIGLDTIKLSKRLLGTKLNKMPLIINKVDPAPENVARSLEVTPRSELDEEILEWLNDHLRAVFIDGEIYYQIPEIKRVYPFSVGKPERIMTFRFCNPSADLKSRLKPESKGQGSCGWTLPDNTTLEQALALVSEHIETTINQASATKVTQS